MKNMIADRIAEWRPSSGPAPGLPYQPLLVTNAVHHDLALELREGQKDIQDESSQAVGRIEILGDRDEGDVVALEEVHQSDEIEQRPRNAVQFVDDDDIDKTFLDVSE